MPQHDFQGLLSEHHKKAMAEIEVKEGSLGKHLEVKQAPKPHSITSSQRNINVL